MRYKSRYEQRHPALSDTGEVEMINSYKPRQCPYCLSAQLAKKGYDANGVQRYQCGECGQIFRPTTNTIFDARKISISEWIDYCLNIFRYVSLTADSWNNRNAFSTSKYWLEKLFLTLQGTQESVLLSGTVWLDETYYAVMMRDRQRDEQGREDFFEDFPAIKSVLARLRIKRIRFVSWRDLEGQRKRAVTKHSKSAFNPVPF